MFFLTNFLSFLSSFGLFLLFGNKFIEFAKQFKSKVRDYTPESHQAKNSTPKIGGLLILITTILSTLIFSNYNLATILLTACLILFGVVGFVDDLGKIRYSKGISESTKFKAQILISLILVSIWYFISNPDTNIYLLGLKFNIGFLLIPWGIFILTGVSNSVNLTDGLDGLATGALIPNFILFALISALTNQTDISIVCCALLGSCLGFLWYNSYPAQIFMGDVGSLPLGAVLGFIALMCRQEFLLLLSGIIFVTETLSVMIQVLFYKLYKIRVFKTAPIHHHFELIGIPESKVTTRFTIISFIGSLLAALIYLKFK